MARKIRYGRGSAAVLMDDTMSAIVRRAIETTQPTVLRRLEREAAELHAEAYGRWPVKTGISRAALEHGIRIVPPNGLEAFVGVDTVAAPYAFFIKAEAGGKHTWTEVVRKPGLARAKKLAQELGRALLDAYRGRG
jgi:hypothetical protein